jgi:hypothetical protein
MVNRLFGTGLAEDAALLRLGTALILKWSLLPTPLREEIIQQALALGDQEPETLRGIIERLLKRASRDRSSGWDASENPGDAP